MNNLTKEYQRATRVLIILIEKVDFVNNEVDLSRYSGGIYIVNKTTHNESYKFKIVKE
jgi:hypothetical protein